MSAGSNRKKQRDHKVSKGIHGAVRHPLNELQKALLGKGVLRSMRHVAMPNGKNWSGTFRVPDDIHKFDAEQAKWNQAHLPFLFDERGQR